MQQSRIYNIFVHKFYVINTSSHR